MTGGRRSIRSKLNVIVAVTTIVALGVAAAALLLVDLRRGLDYARQDSVTQADVIALASAPALAFADRAVALESLSVLRARENVVAAALYDEAGRLFASYLREDADRVVVPQRSRAVGVVVDGEHATAWRPVLSSRERVGTIWLQVRHDRTRQALEYLGVVLLVMAGSLGAALLLSNRLQRAVTGPILDISGVARRILRGEGGSVRATRRSDDEVGELVDAFNAMLDELDRRSAAPAPACGTGTWRAARCSSPRASRRCSATPTRNSPTSRRRSWACCTAKTAMP
jgi:methyl-accepting chemotaxis protein